MSLWHSPHSPADRVIAAAWRLQRALRVETAVAEHPAVGRVLAVGADRQRHRPQRGVGEVQALRRHQRPNPMNCNAHLLHELPLLGAERWPDAPALVAAGLA